MFNLEFFFEIKNEKIQIKNEKKFSKSFSESNNFDLLFFWYFFVNFVLSF